MFIADPVWPAEEPLRPFVFVSLTLQTSFEGKPRNEPSQIWWLEMSEFGDEILSAGRLTAPSPARAQGRPVVERLPSVSVSPSGRVTLAYLTRVRGEPSWRLRVAALSLEPTTHKPVITGVSVPTESLPAGLLPAPPTFSADGQSVFTAADDGRIKEYSLAAATTRRKPSRSVDALQQRARRVRPDHPSCPKDRQRLRADRPCLTG